MPGYNRKIGQSPLQQDAYRLAKLIEQAGVDASGCCKSTTTTTTSTSTTTTTTSTTTTTTTSA